ncbi:MAG: pilus assembly FimT family protein [Verrucomicrobiia bacterium]
MSNTKNVPTIMNLFKQRSTAYAGFTLIEIMIVIAIMALVLAVGIPSIFRAAERDSFRATVNGIIEACSMTRAQAILTGKTQELIIRPLDGTITAPGMNEPVLIARNVQIELLGVNFVELQTAEEARVKFYPNGTSDEFTIVLRSDKNEWRKISLEPVTALADVESDPTKFMR